MSRLRLIEFGYWMNPNLIREKLKKRLEEKKWTISQAERQIGLGPTTFRHFIDGKTNNPKIETLIAFAKGLDMPVSELIDDFSDLYQTDKNQQWNADILVSLTLIIQSFLKEEGLRLTNEEVYPALMELYYLLMKKNKEDLDENFVKAFFKKALK